MRINGKEITSNQYYGGLNRRFDRRRLLLKRLGYQYTGTIYGAMFIQSKQPWKVTSISASVVSIASNRDFIQELRSPISFNKSQFEKVG